MKINFKKPSYERIMIELKDGWHLFVTSFFSNILSNSGNLIIGTFLGDVMVGYYGAIDKIVKAIISIFASITTAIFPHVNRELNKSKKEGIKEILKFAKFVIGAAVIVAIITIITAKIAVYILCGPEYIKYANILRIQSIWIVISIINNFIGIQFLIGISEGYYYSRSFIIAGVIMLCFDIIFINIFGIYTIPFGMIISELSLCIIMLLIIFKKKLYMEVRTVNKIKVLSVFGTRPEAIKMCPLVKVLEKDERIESIVCVTAQHREMLDSVLEIFDVKPQYDLNIMAHGQTIVDISNKVLNGVDKVIKECKPDIVLVHGDTSTTLNGALAAFYNKVPIGHVEAGLRTGDIYSPFPEEANRKLTGRYC